MKEKKETLINVIEQIQNEEVLDYIYNVCLFMFIGYDEQQKQSSSQE